MFERMILSKVDQFVEGALDNEINAAIRKKALVGGISLAIPLPVVGTVVYVYTLWKMYGTIGEISTVPFRDHFWKNLFGAFFVNIVVTLILDSAIEVLSLAGIPAAFLVGYVSLKLSAAGYVKTLKSIYGNRVHRDVNVQQGLANMNSTTTHATTEQAQQIVDRLASGSSEPLPPTTEEQ